MCTRMEVNNGGSMLNGKTNDDVIFKNLTKWIEKSGGKVNSSLILRHPPPAEDDSNITGFKGEGIAGFNSEEGHRGLFAVKPIAKGELLLRIPEELVISGEKLPNKWKGRMASPWLRCLACLYLAQDDPQWEPYVSSLPAEFETLWQWKDEEIAYLDGTTLGDILRADRDEGALESRYKEYVQPYIRYLTGNRGNKDPWHFFQRASMCISTRGFHMKQPIDEEAEANEESSNEIDVEKKPTAKSSESKSKPSSAGKYHGPFLLPVIDLLNHSDTAKGTTLQRYQDTGDFCMVAERDIEEGEEVTHSYGEKLTAAQILQTFGFVAAPQIRGAIKEDLFGLVKSKTPAVLSKQALVDACQEVKASSYPKELKQTMDEHQIEGDTWELENVEGRDLSFLPDQFIVSASTSCDCLSDEVVTLCCTQLLPGYIYSEVFDEPKLLDQGVLEDYFLGKLVVMALLTCIKKRLAAYKPIKSIPGVERDAVGDDKTALQRLLLLKKHDVSTLRAMYGLTIRLEEKRGLDELRNEVVAVVSSLDEDDDDDAEEEEPDRSTKKQKTEASEDTK